jgi:hypothetical protein
MDTFTYDETYNYDDEDATDDDGFEEPEYTPDEDDAYLAPCGRLGAGTSLSVCQRFIGEFYSTEDQTSDELALQALRVWMDANRFYPNIFRVDDHGGLTQVVDF